MDSVANRKKTEELDLGLRKKQSTTLTLAK